MDSIIKNTKKLVFDTGRPGGFCMSGLRQGGSIEFSEKHGHNRTLGSTCGMEESIPGSEYWLSQLLDCGGQKIAWGIEKRNILQSIMTPCRSHPGRAQCPASSILVLRSVTDEHGWQGPIHSTGSATPAQKPPVFR